MIDLGEGVVPSRRSFPRPSGSKASTGKPKAPGTARSLSQRVRSTGTKQELESARRKITSTRSSASNGRPISASDVADRYGSSKGAVKTSPGTRANGRSVTKVPSLSDKRGVTGTPSSRADKAASNRARIEKLRRDTAARSAEARAKAARVKKARTDAEAEKGKDRAGYIARMRKARAKAATGGDFGGPRDTVEGRPRGNPGGAIGTRGGTRPIEAGSSKAALRPGGTNQRGFYGGYYNGGFNGGFGYGCGFDPYYSSCFWSQWGNRYPNNWCSWFWSPFYLTGYCWQNSWFYRGRIGGRFNNCSWFGPFIPRSNSLIIYTDPEPEIIYVEAPAEEPLEEDVALGQLWVEGEGEAVVDGQAAGQQGRGRQAGTPSGAQSIAPESTDPGLQRALNRASAYYLTQGDRAFREKRFGDAAHFYAKSVEFSPERGILYLVLSDALFATGDYRYAAFTLRQAFDREPELAQNVIDKRDFYSSPEDFEAQLKTLERYVEDHILDVDARLVLAANYLFGGRPESALTLLDSPFSEELNDTPSGQLIRASARHILFGEDIAPTAQPQPASQPAFQPAGPREQ